MDIITRNCCNCKENYGTDGTIPICHLPCKKVMCIGCWGEILDKNYSCKFCVKPITARDFYEIKSQHTGLTLNEEIKLYPEYHWDILDAFSDYRLKTITTFTSSCFVHIKYNQYYDVITNRHYCEDCNICHSAEELVDIDVYLRGLHSYFVKLYENTVKLYNTKIFWYFNSKIEEQVLLILDEFEEQVENKFEELKEKYIGPYSDIDVLYDVTRMCDYIEAINRKIREGFDDLTTKSKKIRSVLLNNIKKIEELMNFRENRYFNHPRSMGDVSIEREDNYLLDNLKRFYQERPYIVLINNNLVRHLTNTLAMSIMKHMDDNNVCKMMLEYLEKCNIRFINGRFTWQWLNSAFYESGNYGRKEAPILDLPIEDTE